VTGASAQGTVHRRSSSRTLRVDEPSATVTEQRFTTRDVLARYPALGDDHVRYLRKWGLIRPSARAGAAATYGFSDLAVLRQVSAALSEGRTFRGVVRDLLAERHGQLALDFQAEPAPAKVIRLAPRAPDALSPGAAGDATPAPLPDASLREAERLFLAASALDTGEASTLDEALQGYREALQRNPDLVPALINLANLHYTQGHLPEAQALYERAIILAPEYFEAHFNFANVLQDLGRLDQAVMSYRDAIAANPRCADAHFYLAVALEKQGRSAEARPHWRSYQELAPDGEWLELAKEFSD
jgi:tetratricopeptide (TPR) repeat protein